MVDPKAVFFARQAVTNGDALAAVRAAYNEIAGKVGDRTPVQIEITVLVAPKEQP